MHKTTLAYVLPIEGFTERQYLLDEVFVMMKQSWKQLAWIVAGVTLIAMLSAPSFAGGNKRLTINMNESYEIVGTVYPAGKLTVRELNQYNPTTTLQEVWIGNECIGLLKATSMPETQKSTSNEFLFKRDKNGGQLALVGVAFKGETDRGFSSVQHRQ
jgi:hypothetical protein